MPFQAGNETQRRNQRVFEKGCDEQPGSDELSHIGLGAADRVKGVVKDTAGKLMDDKKLQAEGEIDKAKGSAHEAVGDVKDAVRKESKSD